ncbi:hypothetical protein F2P81_021151 [Scophthalmus maximus]|uniref:Uncharacterized protein n=1 Tax=Scophthalmus maximus TaxID=52904 RepID=A0A6A4S743_SCOMX|nr:hypothetical protein F2P81_021151 [Scophthalmus maximus]
MTLGKSPGDNHLQLASQNERRRLVHEWHSAVDEFTGGLGSTRGSQEAWDDLSLAAIMEDVRYALPQRHSDTSLKTPDMHLVRDHQSHDATKIKMSVSFGVLALAR